MSTCSTCPTTILRIREVTRRLGVCRSTIYSWLNKKSRQHIPDFPKPIRLGQSTVGWIEAEIENYLETRRNATRQLH